MKTNRYILLTFDVEEFDLPLEYGHHLGMQEQMHVGFEGLKSITPLLERAEIQCTLFTTANFATHFPEEIKKLSQKHEIGSHTYFHSSFEQKDLTSSRLELERITGKKVIGLRMPRMKSIPDDWAKDAGYQYNSSINPTWLPGRYNHFFTPRNYYKKEGLITFPASVSPNLRIPLFWLSFKNFPYSVFKNLAIRTLKKDGYLMLYFHPWEFTDLSQFQLPAMVRRKDGAQLLTLLNRLIADLQPLGKFISVENFLSVQGEISASK